MNCPYCLATDSDAAPLEQVWHLGEAEPVDPTTLQKDELGRALIPLDGLWAVDGLLGCGSCGSYYGLDTGDHPQLVFVRRGAARC